MTLKRPWPHSLAGQLALLIALALFVAQAINFALILRDRGEFRLSQATRPVAIRMADALERESANGRALPPDRGRVRRVAQHAILTRYERHPEVETELRKQLTELGIPVGRIETGLRPAAETPRPDPDDRRFRFKSDPSRDHPVDTLMIAVEQPGRGWLITNVQWFRAGPRILWALLGQTLVLYIIVLIPVIWAVRRLSRPLRDLTRAAETFRPGSTAAPLPIRGPEDVAALIAAFNSLSARVTTMLDEKDRMLGAIGHDLRTPLAALRVRIESVEDDDDRARMADTIDEMTRTLEDILSLARLGRPSEPMVDVDLAALVDAVVEDFRDLGHEVVADDVDRLPMKLRPVLMRRAVRNLIENAIKYAGSAEVHVSRTAAGARIEVCDRGPGIPPDKLDAVFDAFIRVESSRNKETGGIGLGLALTRAIVEEAGGTITLTNRPGGGLTAAIELRHL